tara:strand:- start:384 stop:1280 length:897 start_codon:yes stop_codon:yes gene_type:complete
MRLTKETLKKIIKEELEAVTTEIFNEGIGDNFYGMYGNKTQSPKPSKPIKPVETSPVEPEFPPEIDQKHHDKLKLLLRSDDESQVNQALHLIDTLSPDSTFAREYREYLTNTKVESLLDDYRQGAGPDERIELRKQIYDLVNKRAGELYPNDRDAAYDYAYDKINKAGIMQESLMYEGDDSILEHFHGAALEEGDLVCEACLFEQLQEASCGCPDLMGEAEYQGRKVTLNKPMRGDVKKFKVYVKDPKTGNVKKVNFGDPNMKIKKSNPKRRKSFRARHNCDNPGPKTKARYWSCKKW